MVNSLMDRRAMMTAIGCMAIAPNIAGAEDYINLTWADLLPEGQGGGLPAGLQGIIEHEDAPLFNQQPPSSGVRSDWNGEIVRLPGFIVPIDYAGSGVTSFILVPFVGACVHVPPPPANQLVFVTTPEPYEVGGLFDAVSVTGMFGVSSISTHLADIGYALSADEIEPYGLKG